MPFVALEPSELEAVEAISQAWRARWPPGSTGRRNVPCRRRRRSGSRPADGRSSPARSPRRCPRRRRTRSPGPRRRRPRGRRSSPSPTTWFATRISGRPDRAIASASHTVAVAMPRAPLATCRCESDEHLWTLMCGRTARSMAGEPSGRASRCSCPPRQGRRAGRASARLRPPVRSSAARHRGFAIRQPARPAAHSRRDARCQLDLEQHARCREPDDHGRPRWATRGEPLAKEPIPDGKVAGVGQEGLDARGRGRPASRPPRARRSPSR